MYKLMFKQYSFLLQKEKAVANPVFNQSFITEKLFTKKQLVKVYVKHTLIQFILQENKKKSSFTTTKPII